MQLFHGVFSKLKYNTIVISYKFHQLDKYIPIMVFCRGSRYTVFSLGVLNMKHLKPLIILSIVTIILYGVYVIFIAPASRTVDFSGTIDSVRIDEENGSVYITAVQERGGLTRESGVKKQTVCKDENKETADPAKLQAGDKILLNFRGKPKEMDGIYKAVAKSPVKVY